MPDINLETLDLPPSWTMLDIRTGRPGRVDRSACLEVRVSEVRRLASCVSINPDSGKRRPEAGVFPLPGQRQASTSDGRRATGVFTITANMLAWIGSRRPRRKLGGDYRNTRANAMRPVGWSPDQGPLQLPNPRYNEVRHASDWKHHRQRNSFGRRNPDGTRPPDATPIDKLIIDNVLPANPNRVGPFNPDDRAQRPVARGGAGNSDYKVLGLPDDWKQPLRLERWTPHPGLTGVRYYLVCPGCGRAAGESIEPEHINDPRFPGVSRIPWGQNARQSERDHLCPQRAQYLFLPLCTAAEYRDARLAQLWFQSLPAPQRRSPDAARVFNRYHLLFHPRTLLCRHCLRIGYGVHPDHARKHYQRKRHGRQLQHKST